MIHSTHNPQKYLKDFKDRAILICRNKAKVAIPKMEATIKRLKQQLKETLHDDHLDKEEKVFISAEIQERINKVEITCHQKIRDHITTTMRLEAESPTSKV